MEASKPIPAAPGPATPAAARRWLVNLFVLAHLFMLAVWGWPPSALRTALISWFQPYVVHLGLWHSWDLFAPNPQKLNASIYAEVVMEDGTRRRWDAPLTEQLGLADRFRLDRHRRWRERVRLDTYRGVWEEASRHVARQFASATNRPVSIILWRSWQRIPPVDETRDFQPFQRVVERTNRAAFATFQFKPADFE